MQILGNKCDYRNASKSETYITYAHYLNLSKKYVFQYFEIVGLVYIQAEISFYIAVAKFWYKK